MAISIGKFKGLFGCGHQRLRLRFHLLEGFAPVRNLQAQPPQSARNAGTFLLENGQVAGVCRDTFYFWST